MLIEPELLTEAQKAMSKTKIALMARPDSAFFTSIVLSLELRWTDQVPTAAASELTLYFNPKFFMDLAPEERLFLLLHEALHVAFLHVQRVKERDHMKWNQAADYVINDLLIQKDYKMPEGGLHDKQYRDKYTEEVYGLLPDPPENGGGFQLDILPGGPGGEDKERNNQSPPPEQSMTPQELKDKLDDILVRAKTASEMSGSKAAGTVPGELEIYIDQLTNPKLPWYSILHKYFTKFQKTDYSFRKPNRRFFPDMLLPSQHSEAIGDLAVAVDTSGSVSQEEFDHFMGETYAILKRLKPTDIHFLQFDTRIKSVDEIKSVSDMAKVKFSGRGGTSIFPVTKWAREHKPTAMVIFTDGYFSMDTEDPKVPVIWVINGNPTFTAPYGRVIHYEFN